MINTTDIVLEDSQGRAIASDTVFTPETASRAKAATLGNKPIGGIVPVVRIRNR
jgi:hypothetical protein